MSEPDPDGSRSWRRTRTSTIGVGVLLAAVVAAGVVLVLRAEDEAPAAGELETISDHVHALGADPVDQSILVATHSGLHRVRGSQVVRIGSSYQDMMGFAVIGAGEYVGSGHPDAAGFRAGRSGLMGLIRSTDGGRTWNAVSLDGDSDLHQIRSTERGVLAWDDAEFRLLATDDLVRWETRSTIDLGAFAADSTGARLLATTADGTKESVDGGRTWRLAVAPVLETVEWSDAGEFVGVDPDGAIWFERAGEWVRTGDLPVPPSALLVSGDRLIAAMDGDGSVTILESTDDGGSWTEMAST